MLAKEMPKQEHALKAAGTDEETFQRLGNLSVSDASNSEPKMDEKR